MPQSNASIIRFVGPLRKNPGAFACVVCIFFALPVMSGPPFRTDDPEPVEYLHWEFYLASQLSNGQDGLSGTAPNVEINYGIFNEMQVHLIVPFYFNRPSSGATAYGPGDLEAGLKYRFVIETSSFPQIGVFPLLEIPTGNSAQGLGAGNVRLFLPLWLQKTWGAWTLYGGGGYLADITPRPVNSWYMGCEGQRDLSKAVTLGAEVFSVIVPSQGPKNESAFNIGAIFNFNDHHHVLVSAGRDIIGDNDLFLYAAYQLTIGQSRPLNPPEEGIKTGNLNQK